MIDWHGGMTRTYEFWEVNPQTWLDSRKIGSITDASIVRDMDEDTCGHASFSSTDELPECYVRTYLIARQGDQHERVCLGTHMVQTPSVSFDGIVARCDADGYTPLIEMSEKYPPIGFTTKLTKNLAEYAREMCKNGTRAPLEGFESDESDPKSMVRAVLVAENSDTALSFATTLLEKANMHFEVAPDGTVGAFRNDDSFSMRPTYVFDDSNSSILLPDVSDGGDLFGIPNVVEIISSTSSGFAQGRAVNSDPASPTSTVSRGREIVYRDTSPDLGEHPTDSEAQAYAKKVLVEKSSVERTVTFSHAFVPNVTVGSCVMLDYERFGKPIVAVIKSQDITCDKAMTVNETATYTVRMFE